MNSEGSFDTEDWSNDAKNSALHHMDKCSHMQSWWSLKDPKPLNGSVHSKKIYRNITIISLLVTLMSRLTWSVKLEKFSLCNYYYNFFLSATTVWCCCGLALHSLLEWERPHCHYCDTDHCEHHRTWWVSQYDTPLHCACFLMLSRSFFSLSLLSPD